MFSFFPAVYNLAFAKRTQKCLLKAPLIKTPKRRERKEGEQAHFSYCKQLHQHLIFKDPLLSRPAYENFMWSPQAPSAVRRLIQQLEAQPQQCRYMPLPANSVLGYSARQGSEIWAFTCDPQSCQHVSPWHLYLAVHLPRVKSLFTPCATEEEWKGPGQRNTLCGA